LRTTIWDARATATAAQESVPAGSVSVPRAVSPARLATTAAPAPAATTFVVIPTTPVSTGRAVPIRTFAPTSPPETRSAVLRARAVFPLPANAARQPTSVVQSVWVPYAMTANVKPAIQPVACVLVVVLRTRPVLLANAARMLKRAPVSSAVPRAKPASMARRAAQPFKRAALSAVPRVIAARAAPALPAARPTVAARRAAMTAVAGAAGPVHQAWSASMGSASREAVVSWLARRL
jgi:hypothetical protein